MNEETIAIALAGIALAVFLFMTRNKAVQTDHSVATPQTTDLSMVATSQDISQGPAYFIANQPYYFAPPVSSFMPPATASNTIATNQPTADDGGCGCLG